MKKSIKEIIKQVTHFEREYITSVGNSLYTDVSDQELRVRYATVRMTMHSLVTELLDNGHVSKEDADDLITYIYKEIP